ncbi:MAG: hypothetical protein JWR80_9234 [Bradyrhizobium sp.]|nr:hypothetical protein [Bradyrhizobium sp.]
MQIIALLNAQLDTTSDNEHFLGALSAVGSGLARRMKLVFEVVDLRPRKDHSPPLESALRGLLVGRASVEEPQDEIVQLLLVGDTLSLDEWDASSTFRRLSASETLNASRLSAFG